MNKRKNRQSGVSVIELMFAIALLSIILGLAIPTFRETIQNNRLIAQNNEFVTALNYARSEALRRAGSVTVCASGDGATCSGDTNWSTGWIVFADPNSDGTLTAPEAPLQVWPATGNGLTLNAGARPFIRYTSTGMSAFAETFSLLKPGCTGNKARQVSVARTGRISTTTVACS